MLSRQEQSHRALGHSRSDSILSRSAAEGLLQGLSTPHASEFHFSSSQPSRNASSSSSRPPRPARSPLPHQRRVSSNPPPLPTTLPTQSRVVPLIPGLGFHLAQRRAAEATSNPLPSLSGGVNNFDLSSPSSNYSHPDDTSSSDSDDCPPTESDRPDSVAPAPQVSQPWQESDNYHSPLWAGRWSRRGSEASGATAAGGRGTGAGAEPSDRRPSFSAFSAARRRDSFDSGWDAGPSESRDSSADMRRRSSSSSLIHDSTPQYLGGAGRGQPTARRNSNASGANFPNFPFPFPGGGGGSSKASLPDSMNGAGGSSMNRRDSTISIRYSDDDGDAWDDLLDPDSALLSRRSSYDSSFAFDRGRASSFSYSPTNNSFLRAKRQASQDSLTFGSLPRAASGPGFRRNSSQGSLRDLPRPPPTSYAFGSRNSSITGGTGGLVLSRRGSWQSQMGLMISGGRMERNMSVDSVGEVERIRRLGGMRELNRRESEVLEMGWRMLERSGQYAHEESHWGQPGVSHWSPSTAESSSSVAQGQHDDASSPELPDTSSSESSPTSPVYTQERRTHYLEPAGTYQEKIASLESPLETLSPLPPSSSDLPTQRRVGHRPQISFTFSFESSAKNSPQTSSSHSRDLSDLSPQPLSPLTQDPKASRGISSSPGRLLAAMLADQSQSEEGTTDSESELEGDPSRDVQFATARRGALSPVIIHNGSEFPMASTAPLTLSRPRGSASTPSDGSSDLNYLAQSIRICNDSTEDVPISLPPLTPPPGLLPSLAIQRPRTLRSAHSMSALKGEHGARTYDRMAAFNETKDRSSGEWSPSPFEVQPVTTPSTIKTSYVGPSLSSEVEQEDEKRDITPRPSRRRPVNLRASLENFAASSSSTEWEAPWSSAAIGGILPLVYDKTPPMQTVRQPGQRARRDAYSSSITPSNPSPSSYLRRSSANPPPAPVPVLSTKQSTISLPFERAFVQRAKEERKAGSIGGSFASSSSSNGSTSLQQQCNGSAIHPDSGLCYCRVAYLSSSQRMSKPSARLAAPHLPPPHLRLPIQVPVAEPNVIDRDYAFDKSKIRFSMPAPLADPEVLPKIPTRSIPLPVPESPLPSSASSSRLGGPKKVLSRLFATHRKTASSGTF